MLKILQSQEPVWYGQPLRLICLEASGLVPRVAISFLELHRIMNR